MDITKRGYRYFSPYFSNKNIKTSYYIRKPEAPNRMLYKDNE